MLQRIFSLLILVLCVCALPNTSKAQEMPFALMISYDGFEKEEDLKVLQDHLNFLAQQNISLSTIENVPGYLKKESGKTLTLSFNHAHPDFMRKAHQLLYSRQVPYTLIVDLADWRKSEDITFLQTLKNDENVTIGLHTLHYEVHGQISDFRHELVRSKTLFEDIFDVKPKIFSFTKGLYTTAMRDFVQDMGFDIILGQQSGAISDINVNYVWPQFKVTPYKNFTVQGLDIILQTRPLPISDMIPDETLVDTMTPSVGFTIDTSVENLDEKLKCLIGGKGKAENLFLLKNRVELRPKLNEHEKYDIHCLLRDGLNEDGTSRWRRQGIILQYIKPFELEELTESPSN